MMAEKTVINASNIDKEKLRKAQFVIKTKGSSMTAEVRKLVEQYAVEYDLMFKPRNMGM